MINISSLVKINGPRNAANSFKGPRHAESLTKRTKINPLKILITIVF